MPPGGWPAQSGTLIHMEPCRAHLEQEARKTAAPPPAPPSAMPPPPPDPERAWATLCAEVRNAQVGLLRLNAPALDDGQLEQLADSTAVAATGKLAHLPHDTRMAAGRKLLADTRAECDKQRGRGRGRDEDERNAASRSRSASADERSAGT